MRYISLILASFFLLTSCVGKSGNQSYETPLFRLEVPQGWITTAYPGQLLDAKNAYTFAIFTLAPVDIKNANDDVELPYGFTAGSFAYEKIEEGVFDSKLEPYPNMQGIKVTKSERIVISGLEARWEEAEIDIPGHHNFNMRVDIPLDKGYIELDAWGPFDDEELKADFRAMASSLAITNKNQFKDHPEIFKKGQP